jgi:hypothetical protein
MSDEESQENFNNYFDSGEDEEESFSNHFVEVLDNVNNILPEKLEREIYILNKLILDLNCATNPGIQPSDISVGQKDGIADIQTFPRLRNMLNSSYQDGVRLEDVISSFREYEKTLRKTDKPKISNDIKIKKYYDMLKKEKVKFDKNKEIDNLNNNYFEEYIKESGIYSKEFEIINFEAYINDTLDIINKNNAESDSKDTKSDISAELITKIINGYVNSNKKIKLNLTKVIEDSPGKFVFDRKYRNTIVKRYIIEDGKLRSELPISGASKQKKN